MRAISYTHQTRGARATIFACDHTLEMEKTVSWLHQKVLHIHFKIPLEGI